MHHVYLSFIRVQDFKEQVIHHTATLTLLGFSWISNYIRIGTIVMAIHDCSDIILEVSARAGPIVYPLSFLFFYILHPSGAALNEQFSKSHVDL